MSAKIVIKVNFNIRKAVVGLLFASVCLFLCLTHGALLQGAMFASCFLALSLLEIDCGARIANILNIIWCIFTAVAAVVLSQLLLNVGLSTVSLINLFWGVVIAEFVISLFFVLTMNYRLTVIIGIISSLLLATVNHFVFGFRGSEFSPYDFLAATTAFSIVEKYTFELTIPMIYSYFLGLLYCYCGFSLPKAPIKHSAKRVLICISFSILLFISFILGTSNIKALHFSQMGSFNNGYLLNFSLQFRNMGIKKPDNYSKDIINKLESAYSIKSRIPIYDVDVIVIMSEALGDVTIFDKYLNTNADVMPFIQSIQEDTIKGHALVSAIGGGTSNSEYEFLTSNSLGLLPIGCFPFQQYIEKGSYSIVTGLENYGFTTLGTHPADKNNYMRSLVYPSLGFNKSFFMDDYPNIVKIREMISDQEMFDQLIDWYEGNNELKNQFIFGVTMQNHSPYNFENIAFSTPTFIYNLNQQYPDVEQYLSLLNESDHAFHQLFSYFSEVDNDVIIVVFGDHMPQLNPTFYEELHGGPFDTLEEQMLQYTVPFFIWANYDIEEQDIGLTSLNFLSNYVYEAAGLPLPAYNAFLKDVQEIIPAMNAFGYYSKTKNEFIPYEEAEGKEAEMLELYQILQYNSLFDEENRSQIFFPKS